MKHNNMVTHTLFLRCYNLISKILYGFFKIRQKCHCSSIKRHIVVAEIQILFVLLILSLIKMVSMKPNLLLLLVALCTGNLFSQTTILDFETPGTSTTFQYFGSTLDGTLGNIIANPDPSGINTSATVAEHIKPDGSQVWAGAFSNPNPAIQADMAANSQICLKVWSANTGKVSLKLENSPTGGDNWITDQTIDQASQWVEVCFNAALPSVEAPFTAATGHVYATVVVFFDFGSSPAGTDWTYYWDDLVLKSGGGSNTGTVTFSVNMNDYTDPFTTVYVSGTFNGWSGDANAMSDDDGDGIWTATVADVAFGPHEFKFTIDNWAAQELFSPYYGTCLITTTNVDGTFVNRRLSVSGDATLPEFCFNSCYSCGEGVEITFQVGSGNIVASPDGLFVAGGGNFGNPGDYPLNDDDGNGVWELTVERANGFESFFTFTNGNCPDYSCKENIEGQSCANPDNFNDRKIGPVTQNVTLATCFGECTDGFDTCSGSTTAANVTFQVDMNDYTEPFTTVYLSGQMNGWAGDANPLTDADGDGVWETTLMLAPDTYEYKFTLDNWAVDEQFAPDETCVISINNGEFVNRIVTVEEDMTVCFFWNTCDACEALSTNDLTIDNNFFNLQPNLVDNFTNLSFAKMSSNERLVRVFSATGVLVFEQKVAGSLTMLHLNTSNFQKGIYLVNVLDGDVLGTQKMLKL